MNTGAARDAPSTSATVLLRAGYAGSWPAGLDPATNQTGRANLSLMNAIYGGLFQLKANADGSDPAIVGVIADSYTLSADGRTVEILLREGVKFSDGTPLDAEAVKFNIERALESSCTCSPTTWPWSVESPVTTSGEFTVQLHFHRPYPAVMNNFPTANINWVASPTAVSVLGEDAFRMMPVGAGPFRVVRNVLSTRLELERNPLYWERDRPYLDRLTFQSVGDEQAALQALLSGTAQAFEGMTSPTLIQLAQSAEQLQVTIQPATSTYLIQLNTRKPPFNDARAREAIYYATDVNAVLTGIFKNWYLPSQSFTAPGGLFFEPAVNGYRNFDVARAREIVRELGGLTVHLATIKTFVDEQQIVALQTQWQQAGIEVSIATYELAPLIEEYRSGQWEAMLQAAGGFDPESTAGVSARFRSDQTYSGVSDEELDRLLLDAASEPDFERRADLYQRIAEHISANAYAPFLFGFAPAQVSVQGMVGPGLTTKIPPVLINSAILWQEVRYE